MVVLPNVANPDSQSPAEFVFEGKVPPLDGLAEFKVLTSADPAQYKSGIGLQCHGTLLRNPFLIEQPGLDAGGLTGVLQQRFHSRQCFGTHDHLIPKETGTYLV
jgi:hypothetical protein